MKKAKIILTIVIVFAFIGGALAFKATNRGLIKILIETILASTRINGVATTYTASPGQPYCTTTDLFTTLPGEGLISTYATTAGAVTLTAPVGGGTFTYYRACPHISGWITTIL